MVKKGHKKGPSHQDLVKTVSKQLKYYFEIRRQEDGFDLSGPECPRPDYPALKSRPMLLYEGLHDRSVKHFYSEVPVKQKITHMTTYDTSTAEAKRMEKLMKKTMDRTSYLPTPLLDYLDKVVEEKPPWAGTGMYGEGAYTKNSEKYLAGTFGDWKMKPKSSRRRGYGKPDNTLKNAFTDPPGAKPRLRRSCPSGWIDNKECNRLVHGASRILASSEFREGVLSRPQSSKSHSQSSTRSSQPRARSASPRPTKTAAAKKSSGAQKSRLIQRPQSGRNTLSTQNSSSTITRRSSAKQSSYSYHDAKDQVVKDHEDKRTSQNLKKGRIYYDIDGRRKPVQHKVKNEGGYMEREGETAGRVPDGESSDEKVPDWLKLLGVEPTEEEMERNQMRRQDVNEKKMPYNNSVKPVEVTEKTTAQGEDVTKREGVRARRPRSARRSKSRDSRVTLSEGSYEEVKLTDSEDSEEETFVEDRGCQTGWELFVQYDQTENILYDGEGETATYKIIVRTGNSVGASTKANVHVVLYGPRGRSTDLMLTDCENHKIPFQQGAEDIFYVTCSYVGDLRKIQIGHDSEGEAWFLDSVSVQDQIKGEVYELLCNKWMSIKAEDKMTRRHLQISATRKIEPDIKVDEEEDETSHEDVIDKVHTSNSPRPSVGASTTTKVSTSHLNNETDTAAGSTSRKQSSLSLPSDTASTSTITKSPRSGRRRQEPYVTFREGNRGRRSPDNIEDFESDVPLQSDKRSVSSRRSESPTVTDSECQTARFEEQSVLSGNTEQTRQRDEELAKQQEMDRLESFKAGQRAERERQRVEKLKHKESEAEMLNDIMRGPTIHQAAKSGDLARINKLLEHNNELKDSVSGDGHTPLHLAAQQGHKEVVQLLAALGAKLDERDRTGYEPTHEAALYGHVNCLMILVAMGASINSKTDDSKTPLHLAAMGGHLETTKWLVANRSRLQVEDDFGRTAVDMAENNGHDAVAKVLRTCINELKSKRTSLESLLAGNEDEDAAWKDDKAEMPIVQHQQAESDDEGASLADLRRDAKKQDEAKAKQKAYQDMQQSLQQENMTFLDRVRNEVDTS